MADVDSPHDISDIDGDPSAVEADAEDEILNEERCSILSSNFES